MSMADTFMQQGQDFNVGSPHSMAQNNDIDGMQDDSSPWYEERQTPGAGIGMFATQTIPSGTRVVCEAELFTLPEDANIFDVYRAVTACSPEAQREYYNLAACSHKNDMDWGSELRNSYTGQSEDFQEVCENHELALRIYETNRFTVRSPNGSRDRLGIFVKSARMNHSCAPNVFHRHNHHINRLTIHALRDIQPGEEIYTSYIDICHPTAQRRHILSHWGFKCRCIACCARERNQERRRKRMEPLLAQMKEAESNRPWSEGWTDGDYRQALKRVEELIGLMVDDGMEESDTLGEAYANAAEYALNLGRLAEAKYWAEETLRIESKCCGQDSQEYANAAALVQACAPSSV